MQNIHCPYPILNEADRKAYERAMRAESDKRSRAETEWWDKEGYPAARKKEWQEEEKNRTLVETAQKCIKKGMSNEDIANITNFPIDQIEELRKKES